METDEMSIHELVSENRIPNDVDVHVLRNLEHGDGNSGKLRSKTPIVPVQVNPPPLQGHGCLNAKTSPIWRLHAECALVPNP